jgi:hypothetical protein
VREITAGKCNKSYNTNKHHVRKVTAWISDKKSYTSKHHITPWKS